jgi:peptidoglycan hydrolase-like protein with peptidoglycan-binding domain
MGSIPAGDYKVRFGCAEGDGYTSEFYNNQQTFEAANLVTITGGMMTNGIDAALSPSATGGAPAKIGVYQNGTWYLDANQSWDWNGTPTDILGIFGVGLTGAVPVVGDWNGDGKTEIGVYIDGIWYLDMNGNWQWDGEGVDVRGVFGVGLPNAIPVIGDWNGDGRSEIGIYSDGNWYLDKNQSWAWEGEPTDTFGLFGTGLPNVVPVTGDWNGDGTTEIGVYSEGNWYLDKNQSWQWEGTPADTYGLFGVGLPNVIPVTGDWNGDGTTKIGVYSEGNWYLDTNASWDWNGTPTDTYGLFGVGLGTVVPVTGNW